MQNEVTRPVPLPRTPVPLPRTRINVPLSESVCDDFSEKSANPSLVTPVPKTRHILPVESNVFQSINFESPIENLGEPSTPPPPYELYDEPKSSRTTSQNICYEEVFLPNDVAENENRLSNASGLSVQNSLYGNANAIVQLRNREEDRKPTPSVVLQFDPLRFRQLPSSLEKQSNVSMLYNYFQENLYGNQQFLDDLEEMSSESSNAPEPPIRFDSLPDYIEDKNLTEETAVQKILTTDERKKSWIGALNPLNLLKLGNAKEKCADKPHVTGASILTKGALFKVISGPVGELFGDIGIVWAVLQEKQFALFADNSLENVKENFSLETFLSIRKVEKETVKISNQELECFEIFISGRGNRGRLLYGTPDYRERDRWLAKLAEALAGEQLPFHALSSKQLTRIGWGYVRESCTGSGSTWSPAWLAVQARRLWYHSQQSTSHRKIDLRKACLVSVRADDGEDPILVIGTPSGSTYFRGATVKETHAWCAGVTAAARDNGLNLDEQQLTRDDVPVLVEKCLDYVYCYGSASEGIYRKNGSEKNVKKLLDKFHRDAWSVVLRSEDVYDEHDVAAVVKRFIRELPEPIFGLANVEYLAQIGEAVISTSERIGRYISLIEDLDEIARNTLRKLLGHLNFIASRSDQNKMSAENLAAVWAPALIRSSNTQDDSRWKSQCLVLKELITDFRLVFPAFSDELEREKLMLIALDRAKSAPNRAGDLRVWIRVTGREEPLAISLGPRRTVKDVCEELLQRLGEGDKEGRLCESVLGGSLTRYLSPDDRPLDVVLTWTQWNQEDRQDNHLILEQVTSQTSNSVKVASFSEEVRYADDKVRYPTKGAIFRVQNGRVAYFRDKNKVCEWPISELIWYKGAEHKRSISNGFPVTFILRFKNKIRTKATPYFGHLIVLDTDNSRNRLLSLVS